MLIFILYEGNLGRKFPKVDANNKIIPYSVVGLNQYTSVKKILTQVKNKSKVPIKKIDSINYSPNHSKTSSNNTNKVLLFRTNSKLSSNNTNKAPILIDNKKIDEIFDQARKRSEDTKKVDQKNLVLFPKEIQIKLMKQERLLKAHENYDKESSLLSKLISKKINKNESKMLINTSCDSYLLKQQLINLIEDSKTLDERYGKNCWTASLRRPKKFNGSRNVLLNLGSDKNPKFIHLRENAIKNTEIIQRPISQSNSAQELSCFSKSKTDFYKTLASKTNTSIENIKNLSKVQIEGVNLIEHELSIIKNMKGRKLLYKFDSAEKISKYDFDCDDEFNTENSNNNNSNKKGYSKNGTKYSKEFDYNETGNSNSALGNINANNENKKNKLIDKKEEVIKENFNSLSFIKSYKVKTLK